jgi:hypothetical protein
MKDQVFAEMKLGRSYLRYKRNGKLTYRGNQGQAIFAAVMHHATMFGHGNPLPAMVAVHKALKDSTLTIHWENKPRTKLDDLQDEMQRVMSPSEKMMVMTRVLKEHQHGPDADYDIAKKMLAEGGDEHTQ